MKQFVIDVVKEASKLALAVQQEMVTPTTVEKADKSPVTVCRSNLSAVTANSFFFSAMSLFLLAFSCRGFFSPHKVRNEILFFVNKVVQLFLLLSDLSVEQLNDALLAYGKLVFVAINQIPAFMIFDCLAHGIGVGGTPVRLLSDL